MFSGRTPFFLKPCRLFGSKKSRMNTNTRSRARKALQILCLTAASAVMPVFTARALEQTTSGAPVGEAHPSRSSEKVSEDHTFSKKDIKDFVGLSIPILSIILGIGMGGFAVALEYRRRRDLINMCHLERMAALEKGLELPPFPSELFQDTRRSQGPALTPEQCLKPGVILVAGGLGVGTLVSMVALWKVGVGVGALLIFSGLGFLAIHRFGPKSGGPGTRI